MSSEYTPFEIQAEIMKRLPLKPLLRFRSVSKPWKRLIDSPNFRSSLTVFISPPTIVSYMCDKLIPVEVQAEILKMLPLKSLIQFRCVSKSFKRLIDSRYFMDFYGVRQPQPHRFILRCQDSYAINDYKFLSFVDGDNSLVDDFYFHNGLDRGYPELIAGNEGYPCVVGSSHGLLCFKIIIYEYPDIFVSSNFNISETVVLWNPSISKHVRIVVPDSPNYNCRIYRDGIYEFGNYGDDDVVGFGVCPFTFDPIILKIKRIEGCKSMTEDMTGNGISLPWRVQVFTLSTGAWSVLSTNLPRESIRLRGPQVVIDRFIYWVAFDYMLDGPSDQSRFLIMSFDLIAKEFKEINLTDGLANQNCSIQSISKLRESLVLLEYHIQSEEGMPDCCLWMMKKEGVNISFTKLYNINVPHATVKTLLGFRKTGELILLTKQRDEERCRAHLKIYNPNSEAIQRHWRSGDDYSYFMCCYMETLLLVDQLDGFMHSISN